MWYENVSENSYKQHFSKLNQMKMQNLSSISKECLGKSLVR